MWMYSSETCWRLRGNRKTAPAALLYQSTIVRPWSLAGQRWRAALPRTSGARPANYTVPSDTKAVSDEGGAAALAAERESTSLQTVARAPAGQWLDTGATGGGNGQAQRRVWAVRALRTVGQETPSPSTAEWPPQELLQCDLTPPERAAHWPKQAPHTASPRQAMGGLACSDNGPTPSEARGLPKTAQSRWRPPPPTPAAAAPILKHRGHDPDVPWQSSWDQ